MIVTWKVKTKEKDGAEGLRIPVRLGKKGRKGKGVLWGRKVRQV